MQNQSQQYESQNLHAYPPEYRTGYPAEESPVNYTQPSGSPIREWPAYHQPHMAYSQEPLVATPLPHADGRFIAALSYSLGWFSGLIFLIFARHHYVRFHARQALLFFGGINLLDIGLIFMIPHIGHFWFLQLVLALMVLMVNVIAFVGWVVGMFQAYRGSYYQLLPL